MRMKLSFTGFGLVLLLGVSFLGVAEQEATGQGEIFQTGLPTEVHEAVDTQFLQPRTPSVERITTSGNLEVEFAKTVSMTFVYESAGFRNSVGYFTYDEEGTILEEHTVFENFSGTGPGLLGGGTLNPGDTMTIGSFAPGERIGFFLIANGYRNADGRRWYTLPEHNADGKDHDAVVVLENIGRLIGFEDLWNLGDRDYNDAMFLVTTAIDTLEEEGSEITIDEIIDAVAEEDEALAEQLQEALDAQEDEEDLDEESEEAPVAQKKPYESPLSVATQQVRDFLGISEQQAQTLVSEHGLFAVMSALSTAVDSDSFWSGVLGYERLDNRVAGGGGASEDDPSLFMLDFQLRHPVTGELIASEHVTLTVAQSVLTSDGLLNNILDVVVVPFNHETQSYTYDLRSLSLASGFYELCLGFTNGTHEVFGVYLPASE